MSGLEKAINDASKATDKWVSALDRVAEARLRLAAATARREGLEAAYRAKYGKPAR